MRYKCNHCGSTFKEPEYVPVETGVVDDTGYYRETKDMAICPDCGYDEIEEYVECLICDAPALGHYDYCPGCMVELKMGLEEDVITDKSRIIILKTEAGDLVGIIVDQVNQVLTLDSKNIEKVRYDDKKGKANATFVSGVGHYDGGLVSILDLDAVVSEKEVKEKASNAS